MTLIVVDVESDGPVPPIYSMVCFGAVVVDRDLDKTFYRTTRPISDKFDEKALAVSGFSREDHLKFGDPAKAMLEFSNWVRQFDGGRPVFISDNPAYDWQFINYYLWQYTGANPFGWSARRIGDIFCGLKKDMRTPWKKYRTTKHTHNPVDDAKGNAEALLVLADKGVKGIIKP